MAEALARAGAAVVIGDIREELGEATADAIKKSGAQAAFLPLDVTGDASWERASSGAIAELGGLDIVVNNAGVEISSLVIDLDPDDVRKMLEVNILGTSLGIKHAFRAMRPGGPAGPMALLEVIMCGLSRWNSIFRMTLVTLGSPGLRAGKSPDFLVLRGLARAVAGEGARGEDLEQERGEREIGLLRGKKPRPYRSRRPGHAGS